MGEEISTFFDPEKLVLSLSGFMGYSDESDHSLDLGLELSLGDFKESRANPFREIMAYLKEDGLHVADIILEHEDYMRPHNTKVGSESRCSWCGTRSSVPKSGHDTHY